MGNSFARFVSCLLVAFCCASCGDSDSVRPGDPSFGGAWGLQSIDGESGVRVYARLESLTGDRDGYLFGPGGSLLVRDAGWCATPPLTYSNYEGSWVEADEDRLVLTYAHWDEPRDHRLTIISLGEDEMRCVVELID